jgi:hypothetical protein
MPLKAGVCAHEASTIHHENDTMSDDEKKSVVIPRSAILSELAARNPDSPEARALRTARQVLGPHADVHLAQDNEGLMLIVGASEPGPLRFGYLLNAQGQVVRSDSQDLRTGGMSTMPVNPPSELQTHLESLKEWTKVTQLD